MTPESRSPIVSIITPCYNAAAFLPETIRSVQAQSFKRWEMLIADDGSTDDSVAVARSFAEKDPRICVLPLGRNSGIPSIVRNHALGHAHGKVLAFLDADDIWKPNKLAVQLARLKRTRRQWGFANVESFGGGDYLPDGSNYPLAWRPGKPFFNELLAGEGVPCLTIIVTRRLLERISPGEVIAQAFDEDPRLKAVEDWDLALRLAQWAEPDYCPKPIARYRAHAGGISKNPEANFQTRLFLIQKFRRLGALPAVCNRADALQRSKYAAECLLAGRGAWRGELFRACLRPPISVRDVYLASLAGLPESWARKMYGVGLAFKRRHH